MNSDVFKIHSMHIRLFMFLLSGVVNHGLFFPYIVIIFHFLIWRTKVIGKQINARELSFLSVSGIESGRTWKSPHSIPNHLLPANAFLGTKVKTRKLPPCHIRSQQHCWSTPTKLLWHMPIGKWNTCKDRGFDPLSQNCLTRISPFSPGSKSACDLYQFSIHGRGHSVSSQVTRVALLPEYFAFTWPAT